MTRLSTPLNSVCELKFGYFGVTDPPIQCHTIRQSNNRKVTASSNRVEDVRIKEFDVRSLCIKQPQNVQGRPLSRGRFLVVVDCSYDD